MENNEYPKLKCFNKNKINRKVMWVSSKVYINIIYSILICKNCSIYLL